jgi:hypothetical protein
MFTHSMSYMPTIRINIEDIGIIQVDVANVLAGIVVATEDDDRCSTESC